MNNNVPMPDWININFNNIHTSRQTRFLTSKANRLKVGMYVCMYVLTPERRHSCVIPSIPLLFFFFIAFITLVTVFTVTVFRQNLRFLFSTFFFRCCSGSTFNLGSMFAFSFSILSTKKLLNFVTLLLCYFVRNEPNLE